MQRPPRAGIHASLGVDAALACGAFGQSVTVIFEGDGLELLIPQRMPQAGESNLHKLVLSLPLYDIAKVYAVAPANLQVDTGELEVDPITPEQCQQLIANSRHVISF